MSDIDRLHDELAEWTAELKARARERADAGLPVATIPMVEILYAEYQGRHTFNVVVAGSSVARGGGATREQAARECWRKLAGVREDEVVVRARAEGKTLAPGIGAGIDRWLCLKCGSRVTAKRPGYWSHEKMQAVHTECWEGEAAQAAPPEVAAAEGGETTTDVGRARTREARLERSVSAPERPVSEAKVRAHKRKIRIKGGEERTVRVPAHTRGIDGPKRAAE